MPERRSIRTGFGDDGSVAIRENEHCAAPRPENLGSALCSRALLDEHELAARIVRVRFAKEERQLEWEGNLAVEILVQRVKIADAVFEDERGRPFLSVLRTEREHLLLSGWKTVGQPQRFHPAIRDGRELHIRG